MKHYYVLLILFASIFISSCEKEEETLIRGCTDPSSLNYDANAEENDGSCEYLYGGAGKSRISIAALVELTESYKISIDGEFIGVLNEFYPNGVSCEASNIPFAIVEDRFHTLVAEGIQSGELITVDFDLDPQSCKILFLEDYISNNGGGNQLSSIVFWANDEYNCGPITVNLEGIGTEYITTFFNASPDCGANGAANFSNLESGVYTYNASCSGVSWSGTINLNPNTCRSQLLVPDNGGGGNDTGDAVFWIDQDFGCGPISITLSGVGTRTINSIFPVAPDCDNPNAGGRFNDIPPGNYTFSASCSSLNWNGTVSIPANTCSQFRLTI